MPKIFGSVKYNGEGLFMCETCGYRWDARPDDAISIKNNYKVSCPMCRALKGMRSGEFLNNNTLYRFKKVCDCNVDNLLDYNTDVILRCERCRHEFRTPLRTVLDNNIHCPTCIDAVRIDEAKADPAKLLKQDGDKLIDIIAKPSPIKSIEKTRITTDSLDKLDGSVVFGVSRLLDYNKKLGTVISQCPTCGFQRQIMTSKLVASKDKKEALTCPICAKAKPDIRELAGKYVGSVFNGLKIDKVYTHDGMTLCNVSCLSIANTSLEAYRNSLKQQDILVTANPKKVVHSQVGLALGDVINNRSYCKVCGDKPIATDYRLKKFVTCGRYNPAVYDNIARTKGHGVPKTFKQFTCKDFYENLNGCMCDFCNGSLYGCQGCKDRALHSISMIASQADYQDSLISNIMQIEYEFPSLVSMDRLNPEVNFQSKQDLITLKDAYIDRDGNLCKFCYCKRHAKGLLLTEQEMAEFDHTVCADTNPYMKLYNISRVATLNNPKK